MFPPRTRERSFHDALGRQTVRCGRRDGTTAHARQLAATFRGLRWSCGGQVGQRRRAEGEHGQSRAIPGTKQQLLKTFRSLREQAEQTRAEQSALADDLAHTGGPFPDRLHVNDLVFKFMWDQTETIIRWATWGEQQVTQWPEDIGHPPGPDVGIVLRKDARAGL